MIDLFTESSAHTISVTKWAEGTATALTNAPPAGRKRRVRQNQEETTQRSRGQEVACQNESHVKRPLLDNSTLGTISSKQPSITSLTAFALVSCRRFELAPSVDSEFISLSS
jgi:hypothetical protein